MSEINEQDRLSQLLCAYVLGEADAQERAEIEAALANDPALREERDRLAATVGLVKSSLGKDETLSYQATAEVARAAADMRPKAIADHRAPGSAAAWYRSSTLRAAASIAAVVGVGYLGWREFVVPSSSAGGLITASLDKADANDRDAARSMPEPKNEDPGYDMSGLRALGYPGGSSVAPAETAAAPSVAVERGLLSSAGYGAAGSSVQPEGKLRDQAEGALAERGSSLKAARAHDEASAPVDSTLSELQLSPFLGRFEPGNNVQPPVSPEAVRAIREVNATPSINVVELRGFESTTGVPATGEHFVGFSAGSAPSPTAAAVAPSSPGATANAPTGGIAGAKPGGGGGGSYKGPPATRASVLAADTSLGLKDALENVDYRFEEGTTDGFLGGLSLDLGEDVWGEVDFDVETANGAVVRLELERAKTVDKESEFELHDRFKKAGEPTGAVDAPARQRRVLTPEEREARIEQVLVSCRRRPNEALRDMFFRFWGDNPYEWAANDRLSTFSMDVDTASYTLARNYLVANQLPEKAQIRTEEFVNYFKPDVAPPTKGTFAISTELAPGRFVDRPDKWTLRVAVRGMEVQKSERVPLALTFVIDVSGSMKEGQRLELVKHALRQLVTQLDARDSIAIVAFSKESRLILPMTSAAKRDLIESAIHPLEADGWTNTEAGLRMGYELALSALTKNATNRVVLLTDGVANVGITDPNVLVQSVERQRKAGIYLNTVGVGMNNHNDNLLEQLANKGDGLCNYVDDEAEVRHALVDNFMQALVPIARDAKIQVEFDPAQVESYRLLGYENRAIADADFRNDKVDAGEINSGHQVNAVYEIVRCGNLQNQDAPLAKVSVRFKPPHRDGVASADGEEASEITSPVFAKNAAASFEATSFGYRRAVLAAQFAEFLRRSVHARGDSLDQLILDLTKLAGEKNDPEVGELSDMVVKSKGLLQAEFSRRGELDRAVFDLRTKCFEREHIESARRASDRELLLAMDQQIASLEVTVRTLLDQRLR